MKDDIKLKQENDRIEKLDRSLYNPNKKHEVRNRRIIHDRNIKLQHDFDDENYEKLVEGKQKYKLPTSFFKKIFFAVFLFFIVTIVIAAISLYDKKEKVSKDLIAMDILGQPFVDGGEEFELQIRVQNFNEQNLELPDLIISYPKDSSLDSERVFLRRSLENVGFEQIVTESFDLTLFGQEGDIRKIDAILEYRIAGSSSIFIKDLSHEVILRSTPTQILIDAPQQIVRNQEFVLVIDVSSNSTTQVNKTLLKVHYPRGFEFIRANIPADFNNDTWYFENITKETEIIKIIGRLAALEGQGQSFNIEYGKQNPSNKNEIETVLNAVTHTIEVQKSFIEAQLFVNGKNDETTIIRGGSNLNIVLQYKNTLEEPLENARLVVNLDGDLYDSNSVSVLNGFYNSLNQTITFDQTTSDNLELLQPKERGEFRFRLKALNLVSSSAILTNPLVNFSVDVEGTEVNGKNHTAIGVNSHIILANSDIAVITKTLHYEGPFKNSGSIPPRVDVQTTYTLVFQVTNSSNKINDTKLITFLPQHVEWINIITPSVERNNVSYDTVTRKLTWELGSLRKGLGVGTSQPRELSVQVRVIPSVSQVGNILNLTGDIILSGSDEYTDTKLNFKKIPLTARLQNSNVRGADGRVIQ